MTHHPELKSVACLMGSGYFSSLSQTLFPSPSFDAEQLVWDVSQQLATLASRPLLLWHGDEDDVVPPGKPSACSRRCSKTRWPTI
jgi:predicted esterase